MPNIVIEKTKEEVINKRTRYKKRYGLHCIGFGDIYYRFDENNQVRLIERLCKRCGNFTEVINTTYLYAYCAECRSKDTNKRTLEVYKIVRLNRKLNTIAERICLCCDKKFISKHNGNRICQFCSKNQEIIKFNDSVYTVRLG